MCDCGVIEAMLDSRIIWLPMRKKQKGGQMPRFTMGSSFAFINYCPSCGEELRYPTPSATKGRRNEGWR